MRVCKDKPHNLSNLDVPGIGFDPREHIGQSLWHEDQRIRVEVEEAVKEFFNIRNVRQGEKSFAKLPDEHKSKLVEKLTFKALESKEADVKRVAELFKRVASKGCPALAFENGLSGIIKSLDYLVIDVPQAYSIMARLLRGSTLPQETVEYLGDEMSVNGHSLIKPKDKLLKAYADVWLRDDDLDQFITNINPHPISTSGRFGDVFKGFHRTVGEVALKRLRIVGMVDEALVIRVRSSPMSSSLRISSVFS